MLHIKGNRECSNMVANADRGIINKKHIKPDLIEGLCPTPGWTLGVGQR